MASPSNVLNAGDYVYVCMNNASQFWSFDNNNASNQGWAYITLDTPANAQLFLLGGRPQTGNLELKGVYVTQDGKQHTDLIFQGDNSTHDLYIGASPSNQQYINWTLTMYGGNTGQPFLYGNAYAMSNSAFPGQTNLQIDTSQSPNTLTTTSQANFPVTILPATTNPYFYCNSGTCTPIVPRTSFKSSLFGQFFTVNPKTIEASGPANPTQYSGSGVPPQTTYYTSSSDCLQKSTCTKATQPPPNNNGNKNPTTPSSKTLPKWVIPVVLGLMATGIAILLIRRLQTSAKQKQVQSFTKSQEF